MNKKKDILTIGVGVVLAIIPWITYELTGDISNALYGLAIDMSLIALALMDCMIDLKKIIKKVVQNDDKNNA